MSLPRVLIVSVHVLAAIVWLGGMFFFALVGAPVLRRVEPADLRADLFRRLGTRFRGLGWLLIGTLIVTGVLNLRHMGLLHAGILTDPTFWSSNLGRALGWKLAGVGTMVVCSALHDFIWGPLGGRLPPGSDAARRARRTAAWLGRANALAGIVTVLAAVRLARGG